MSAEKTRRITRHVLVAMTNIKAVMTEAEEDLANNDLDSFCANLRKVAKMQEELCVQIEAQHGAPTKQ